MYSNKEKIILLILCILGLISLGIFIKYNSLAFPEHNIKFSITRQQAERKAVDFVENFEISPLSYKHTTIFETDELAKAYLERELDVKTTTEIANNLNIWHFSTRFFKPSQKEEYTVDYLPNGRFVGFVRKVEENNKGVFVSKEEAKNICESFLIKHSINLSEWVLISTERQNHPNRSDYNLIYEKKDYCAKDATYRLMIGTISNEVGSYEESFKIPEKWERSFANNYSINSLAQSLAESFDFLLFTLPIFFIFIIQFIKHNFRFKFAGGVSALIFIVDIFTSLNSIPLMLSGFDTTQSWGFFVG